MHELAKTTFVPRLTIGNRQHGKTIGPSKEVPMKIMVVDDEPLLRLMYSEVLREAGYSVVEARTADEGLSILEKGQAVGVVVTDVHMPGTLDGFEFAKFYRCGHRVGTPAPVQRPNVNWQRASPLPTR
jgi:response regulator RpfG family c-di-GMP phosphodiesterase